MSGSNSAERKRHEPLVLVETADISEEDWLDYRRRGIGGSDVSAIFGTSPFRTARDLYYDKLNIASVEDDEGNWVAMEMGHLLEPLVAKIFERKTGYRVYQIKKMFQHPQYPWMLADVDYEINEIVVSYESRLSTVRQTEETNRQLMTSLSHDVRTPLTTLIGYLDAAHKGLVTGKDRDDYIETARRKAHDLKE